MRLKEILLGKAKNIFDPEIFRGIALAAVLAWVGLGADGLSSSCYGPEEIYKSLGENKFLVFPLVALVVFTISILSLSYAQIIELFPTGGGGYVVATKLLGRYPGLITGCSLIVDYILTISISIASGVVAILSFTPPEFQEYKVVITLAFIGFLALLNLRGVRETVLFLLPVFVLFLVSHVLIIIYGLAANYDGIASVASRSYRDYVNTHSVISYWALTGMVIFAFTAGSGTFTGLEAVSNSMQILKEPRVATAKKTMFYMAISLSFVCAGLLFNYLAYDVRGVAGKSLNAVVFDAILPDSLSRAFLGILLVSEMALLFVAAQTGFVGGPRVVAQMALDHWQPRRFVHLSNRLVIQDGIIFVSIAAAFFVVITAANISTLVIIYSTAVFITFVFSQLGMCVHWWSRRKRKTHKRWIGKFIVSFLGFSLSTVILVNLLYWRFFEGGWYAIVLIAAFMVVSIYIRRHYSGVQSYFKKFKHMVENPLAMFSPEDKKSKRTTGRTAILLVSGYNFQGIHLLLTIERLFPGFFQKFIFVSVGEVDYGRFKGISEIKNLQEYTGKSLSRYVQVAESLGAECSFRYSVGTEVIPELTKLAKTCARENPQSTVFLGRIVFSKETLLKRILHDHTASNIEVQLQFEGIPVVMIPLRVNV